MKKNLTPLSKFIDKEVGKNGSKKRNKFEYDYNSFKVKVITRFINLIDSGDQKFLITGMNYSNYIEIVSEKRFGRPCIKGTRISVSDVLNWLSNGITKQNIMADFPELTEEKINACLPFAADRERKLRIV